MCVGVSVVWVVCVQSGIYGLDLAGVMALECKACAYTVFIHSVVHSVVTQLAHSYGSRGDCFAISHPMKCKICCGP